VVKVSRPIVYTLVLGAVAYAAVILTEPEEKRAKPKMPRLAAKTTDRNALVTEEDYKAKFVALNESPRNAFKPLVVRRSATPASIPAGLPAGLTGGDPNWTYSGMAEQDGVRTALLENIKSGEGVFLREGESWQGLRVARIEAESLTVSGGDGAAITLRLRDLIEAERVAEEEAQAEIPPVTVSPGLTGEIGVVPDNGGGVAPPAVAAAPPAPAVERSRPTGREERRRRRQERP
jgi:hypothetical protein